MEVRLLSWKLAMICLIAVMAPLCAGLGAEETPLVSFSGKIDARVTLNDFHFDSGAADDEQVSTVHVRYADLKIHINPSEHAEGFILLRHEDKVVHDQGRKLHMDEGWIKLMYDGAFMRIGRLDMSYSPAETFAAAGWPRY